MKKYNRNNFLRTGRAFRSKNELYITPKGNFTSSKLAATANNVSRPTIGARCKKSNHTIKYNRDIPKQWQGLTWKQLGWDYTLISE